MKKIILALCVFTAGCVSSARYQRLEQRLAEMERRSEPPDKADARNPPAEREAPEAPQPIAVTRAIVPRLHGPYIAFLTEGECGGSKSKPVRNNVYDLRSGALRTWLAFKTTVDEPVVIPGAKLSPTGESLLGPRQRICIPIGAVAPTFVVSRYELTREGFMVPIGKQIAFRSGEHEGYTIDQSWF